MKINNVSVANINSSSNIVPYALINDNVGSIFTDSPIEVIPAFSGYEGFSGLQTHIGAFISAPPTLSIPPFGFKFVNNFIQGSLSQIGDVSGFSQTSVLSMVQFYNSELTEFSLVDNFNNLKYINIQPSSNIYGIGDSVTDGTLFSYGMIVDSPNNRVIMKNTSQAGFIIVPSKDDFRFGMLESDYFIGLRNNSFLVSLPLVESGGGYAPTNNWLRLEWQGQLWYVQLHQ